MRIDVTEARGLLREASDAIAAGTISYGVYNRRATCMSMRYDLAVIGAGAGGLVGATFAARLGRESRPRREGPRRGRLHVDGLRPEQGPPESREGGA